MYEHMWPISQWHVVFHLAAASDLEDLYHSKEQYIFKKINKT